MDVAVWEGARVAQIAGRKASMRTLIRVASAMTFCAALLAIAPNASADGEAKSTVCHIDGKGRVRALSVADVAVDAHLDHGDPEAGDPVPGFDGFVYGETCEPTLAVFDRDNDGAGDDVDNCPDHFNPDQLDFYGSPAGDACEDTDGDGFLDNDVVNEPNFCVSLSGSLHIQRGSARCYSSAGTLDQAIASAPLATAYANFGTGTETDNIAVAAGLGSTAMILRPGDNNAAYAYGDWSTAHAGTGNNNLATAYGYYSEAFAARGDDLIATANSYECTVGALLPGVEATC